MKLGVLAELQPMLVSQGRGVMFPGPWQGTKGAALWLSPARGQTARSAKAQRKPACLGAALGSLVRRSVSKAGSISF